MLFPYSTERELQRVPYATLGLIGLNVVMAAVAWPNGELMAQLIFSPDDFHWWQVITAMFMHAGPEHLIANMVFLWVFGSHVEDVLGTWKYLALYFSAGLAATGMQVGGDVVFLSSVRGLLGASGCIMGLVALFATRFRRVPVNIFYLWWYRCGTFQVAAIWLAALYFAMDVLMGFGLGAARIPTGVANLAHVGGFLAGLLWAYLLRLPAEARADETGQEAARLAASGIYEMAAVTVEQEIQRRPGDPELHCRAATYYEMKPQTRHRATEHWNMALGLWLRRDEQEAAFDRWDRLMYDHNPQQFDPNIICDLAVARENAGQLSAATEIYAVVANGHAASRPAPLAALRLAHLLRRMGDDDLARQWYQTVLERWPDSDEALDAHDGLAQLGLR